MVSCAPGGDRDRSGPLAFLPLGNRDAATSPRTRRLMLTREVKVRRSKPGIFEATVESVSEELATYISTAPVDW